MGIGIVALVEKRVEITDERGFALANRKFDSCNGAQIGGAAGVLSPEWGMSKSSADGHNEAEFQKNRVWVAFFCKYKFLAHVCHPLMSFELKKRKQHWHFNCLIFVLLSLFLTMDAYADDPARIAPKEFDLGNFRIRSIPMTPGPGMTCPTGFWDKIEVTGEIAPETTALVEQFLKEARRCTIRNPSGKVSLDRTLVFLGSNGGFIRDGFKIGELFRNHGVFTVVRPGQICASSCAVAFLGGNERYLSPGAKLVFHAPYTVNSDFSILCSSKSGAEEMRRYFVKMLDVNGGTIAGNALFDRAMQFCGKTVGWAIGQAEGLQYGIINQDIH